MKYEVQQMLGQGSGVIVNNSSMGGLIACPGISPYNASKHAVMGLTRSAALHRASDRGRWRIHGNLIKILTLTTKEIAFG